MKWILVMKFLHIQELAIITLNIEPVVGNDESDVNFI